MQTAAGFPWNGASVNESTVNIGRSIAPKNKLMIHKRTYSVNLGTVAQHNHERFISSKQETASDAIIMHKPHFIPEDIGK